MQSVEHLLARGELGGAWELVQRRLERQSGGPGEAEFLLRASALAGYYGEPWRIEEWSSIYASRHGDSAGSGEFIKAVRCYARWNTGQHDEAMSLDAETAWDALWRFPVLQSFRFVLLTLNDRVTEAFATMQRALRESRSPYDRGHAFLSLLSYFVTRGRVEASERMARRALLGFGADPSLLSRLSAFQVRARLGRIYYIVGRYPEAEACFEGVFRDSVALGTTYFYCRYAGELAASYLHRGRSGDAARLLEMVRFPRRQRSPSECRERARLSLARLEVSMHMEDIEGAAHHLQAARRSLRRCPDRRLEGYVLKDRGRLELLKRDTRAAQRARRFFERAEEIFRSLGHPGVHGLSTTLVARGELHLRRGEVPDALDCAAESLKLADGARDYRLLSVSLLFKSYLLLEGAFDAASESVYEEVLRRLGAVRSPLLLFRVIANLYMYSWNLGDRLDITQAHLNQIDRLRHVLDQDAFHRLYRRYVVEPVARRTFKNLFGRDSFGEE